MTIIEAIILVAATATFCEARHRAEAKRRFARSIERFDNLTTAATAWRTSTPTWADDDVIDVDVIDVRERDL